MVGQLGGVVGRAVDEARLPAAQERCRPGSTRRARRPRRRRGAAARPTSNTGRSTHERSGRKPVAQTIAADLAASPGRGSAGRPRSTRVGSKRSGGPTSPSSPWAVIHASMSSSRRPSFWSARAQWLRSPPENIATPSRIAPSRPRSCTPASVRRLRSRVRRSGVPISWGDATLRALQDLLDLVVALVESSDGVHPVLDVAPPVGAGHAHVLADRQRHRPARRVDLLGELEAGGGGADHQHAAVGQLIRVAVLERVDRARRLPARRRRRRGRSASSWPPMRAPRIGTARCPGRSRPRSHRRRRARGDRRAGLDRSADRAGVALDELRDLARRS